MNKRVINDTTSKYTQKEIQLVNQVNIYTILNLVRPTCSATQL